MNDLPLDEKIAELKRIALSADMVSLGDSPALMNNGNNVFFIDLTYDDGEVNNHLILRAEDIANIAEQDNGVYMIAVDYKIYALTFYHLTPITSSLPSSAKTEDEDVVLEVSLIDEEADPSSLPLKCRVSDTGVSGLYLGFDGYQDSADENYGYIVKIDYYEGELSVLVWGDKEDEDYTHKIPLSGAKR